MNRVAVWQFPNKTKINEAIQILRKFHSFTLRPLS